MVLGFYLMASALILWTSDPVHIVVKDNFLKVSGDLDFPAVTVCPEQTTNDLNLAAIMLNK